MLIRSKGSRSYKYKGVLDKLATRAYSNTNAWTATDHTAYTLDTAGWEGFAQIVSPLQLSPTSHVLTIGSYLYTSNMSSCLLSRMQDVIQRFIISMARDTMQGAFIPPSPPLTSNLTSFQGRLLRDAGSAEHPRRVDGAASETADLPRTQRFPIRNRRHDGAATRSYCRPHPRVPP